MCIGITEPGPRPSITFELNMNASYTITMTPAEGLILKKLERSELLGGTTDLTSNDLSGPDGNGAYIYSTTADINVTYFVTFAEPEAAPTYAITGSTMGGSGNMSFSVGSQTVTSAEAGQRVDITLPEPEQDYYWELDATDADINRDDANHFHFTMPAKSIAVQARYLGGVVINTHIVYFNANGGTGTMGKQIINNGQTESLFFNTFTRDGYSFTGWNTAADGYYFPEAGAVRGSAFQEQGEDDPGHRDAGRMAPRAWVWNRRPDSGGVQ